MKIKFKYRFLEKGLKIPKRSKQKPPIEEGPNKRWPNKT
jgi:hypothetical protein